MTTWTTRINKGHKYIMLTFEAFAKSGYMAYTLSSSSRQQLLSHFKPKYPEVICGHVTYKFPAKSTDELPPEVKEAHVVGYENGDGIEAVVVEINGSKTRPDGKLYHITLSLDRAKGKKPVHSNDLVNKSYQHVSPIAIHLTPAFLQ
jgi:hypothetical protein